jgi:hypothetical protein
LKITNGRKIAVIEYDLQEYVSGDFGNGMLSMFTKDSNDKKIVMRMSHKATALFDLEKGYWILYDAIMDVETNFSLMGMGGSKRTEFKLTPAK